MEEEEEGFEWGKMKKKRSVGHRGFPGGLPPKY